MHEHSNSESEKHPDAVANVRRTTLTNAASEQREPMLVSIVIPNYNYGEFIGHAIDSAIGLDWPAVEIIVVDDGSTDNSHSVIQAYGKRVVAIYQPNAGQRSACNVGFAHAHGQVVIFLDSDDTLEPSLVRELAAVWRPGISKVQFQMKVIDATGSWTGSFLPQYSIIPEPAQIRHWALATGAYPTPPGSGNAYARTFLEKIFPLQGQDPFSDSYCLAAAPFLGDVVTIAKPLVSYRVHGRNDGAMTHLDIERFGRDVARACWRFEYAQSVAQSTGTRLPDAALHKSLPILAYRLASLCLAPERHPIEGDSVLRVLRYLLQAAFISQGIALPARLAFAIWGSLVAISPSPIRKRLVLWRFTSSARPQVLRRVLRALSVVHA